MRSFVPLLLAALLAAANALATPAEGATEISGSTFHPVADRALPPPTPARRMTNAERLARGLPPAAPQRRGTPVRRQGGASPIPTVTYQANIQVRGADGSAIGYVSRVSSGGTLYQLTPSAASALAVSFGLPVGQTSGSQLDVTAVNSDLRGYSLFGLFAAMSQGYNMGAGSWNFGNFGNVGHTAPGAPAAVDGNTFTNAGHGPLAAESAIWSIDIVAGTIVPRWVNLDGSTPALAFWMYSNQFFFGGDMAAFVSATGLKSSTAVSFHLAVLPL